jgi:hypothetical protein
VKGSTKIAIGFLAIKPSENVPDTCPELLKLSVGASRCKTRDSKTWIENNSENKMARLKVQVLVASEHWPVVKAMEMELLVYQWEGQAMVMQVRDRVREW